MGVQKGVWRRVVVVVVMVVVLLLVVVVVVVVVFFFVFFLLFFLFLFFFLVFRIDTLNRCPVLERIHNDIALAFHISEEKAGALNKGCWG